ncbi:transmembrane protein, putative [Bodo saltans]|uniref:Transmembrane protein, putative n=1 Tax=Bodo saltans TaxID=75058 RepID=A0A0S4JZJ1_BODSA|nr:transmembrane protein, putative [Bodo saltans]|eukprot:CUG94004.1 transmembrane protein, putative [Bodo saltans]
MMKLALAVIRKKRSVVIFWVALVALLLMFLCVATTLLVQEQLLADPTNRNKKSSSSPHYFPQFLFVEEGEVTTSAPIFITQSEDDDIPAINFEASMLGNQSSAAAAFPVIDAIHNAKARELFKNVDSSSFLWPCRIDSRSPTKPPSWCRDIVSGTASVAPSPKSGEASAAAPPPVYPTSIGGYRHPFGTCKDLNRRVSLSAYNETFMLGNTADPAADNVTRFWPQLPDARTAPGASEHERCHFVMARSHLIFLRKRWRREFPRDMFLQTEKTDSAFHMWNGKERAIRIKDRYSNFPGMRFSVQKGHKKFRQKKYHLGAHVDVIPLEKRGGKMKILHSYFEIDDIYPLGTVCFENMELPAPRNIAAFLTSIYGDQYMKPPSNASFGGPTVLPCLATQRMRGSPWSLSWDADHSSNASAGAAATPPVRWPREDPDKGSFLSDYKTPHRLYYNSKW